MLKHLLRRHRPARPRRVALHAEWLEPRLLYSADAGALLAATGDPQQAPETRTLTTSYEYGAQAASVPTAAEVRAAYALTPLQFEANAGQLGEGVDFAALGIGYAVRLGGGQAELLLDGAQEAVRLELAGAAPGTAETGPQLATRSNYLVGQDAQQWVTGVANYGSVLYRDVYDGIDIRYYGNQNQLEYDFLLAPGADADKLQLRFHGVSGMALADNGDLVLRVAGTGREIRFQAPVSYQEGAGGREPVESHYEVQADGTVRIVVGAYDGSRAL
ncbi:MAG TPA: LEPR-XLL domain-containing protein, partial [Ramlibacter sp.]